MRRVIACIDGSAYANSVCDHAAWMAGQIGGDTQVLHVVEGDSGAADMVDDAVRRLHEEGSLTATGKSIKAAFPQAAFDLDADLIVMGKRGVASERDRRRLGSNVEAMIRATTTPICLTSKVFLPIGRAVVLLDADMNHRRAVELVAAYNGLQRLEIDVIVAAGDGDDPEPKLEWARQMLAARGTNVFAMEADGPEEAAGRYIAENGADLVVISRAVLAPDPQGRLGRIEDRSGVWGWRTPVLVC